MSDLIESAVAVLAAKFDGGIGDGIGGAAKFVIAGEGALMLDAAGVRAGDEPADVTLTADADTFQAILEGDLSPTAAFMSGRLAIEGDMGLALRLGSTLA